MDTLPDLTFLCKLISCPSVTPKDANAIETIAEFLKQKPLRLDRDDTCNAYFEIGTTGPLLLFVGHTDIVPPGPLALWHKDPFKLSQTKTALVGRGIVDMKGAIWAFCSALKQHGHLNGRIGILLTSDEEGSGKNGMAYAVNELEKRGLIADWALVGEPTSIATLGDIYKHQRRGSYHFFVTLNGQQGHIAYPKKSHNPCDILSHFLQKFYTFKKTLPTDNDLSIFSINTSTHTTNIIPQSVSIGINLRYTHEATIQLCRQFLSMHSSREEVGAKPYISKPTLAKKALEKAIYHVTGQHPKPSSLGGVSDARFLPPIAKEIIEFGLCCNYAHQINEQAPIQDLLNLRHIYGQFILELLADTENKKHYDGVTQTIDADAYL